MEDLYEDLNPDEGVAYGAAMMAGVLSNQLKNRDGDEVDSPQFISKVIVSDVVPVSLGLSKKEKGGE